MTAFLAFCVLLFALIYIPVGAFTTLETQIHAVWTMLVRAGVSIPITFFLQWIIFAQDHLANGRSRASVFFRHCYASSYARERYGIPRDRAQQMWFDYFNKWAAPDHPNHTYYRVNFERSYSLRLIFYLKRVLFVFALLALLVTLLWAWGNRWQVDSGMLWLRIGIALIAGTVAVSLAISNRAICQPNASAYDEKYVATGAYEKFREIAGILRVKFEDEVLSALPTAEAKQGEMEHARGDASTRS